MWPTPIIITGSCILATFRARVKAQVPYGAPQVPCHWLSGTRVRVQYKHLCYAGISYLMKSCQGISTGSEIRCTGKVAVTVQRQGYPPVLYSTYNRATTR
ncbi:hypothetical protein V8C35DRAFT_20374 [Trichoderma chlorosporum]